jgi:hypothetical protein
MPPVADSEQLFGAKETIQALAYHGKPNGASSHESEAQIFHPSLTFKTDEKPDPSVLKLEEEIPGWHGYIEWENYPERKKAVKEYLKKFDFPGPPEFQLIPLPNTNPILEGVRWKQYHYALGNVTKDIPAESWYFVEKEKSPDMIHVLQFPYNGEPPRVWYPVTSYIQPYLTSFLTNAHRIDWWQLQLLEMKTTLSGTTEVSQR